MTNNPEDIIPIPRKILRLDKRVSDDKSPSVHSDISQSSNAHSNLVQSFTNDFVIPTVEEIDNASNTGQTGAFFETNDIGLRGKENVMYIDSSVIDSSGSPNREPEKRAVPIVQALTSNTVSLDVRTSNGNDYDASEVHVENYLIVNSLNWEVDDYIEGSKKFSTVTDLIHTLAKTYVDVSVSHFAMEPDLQSIMSGMYSAFDSCKSQFSELY